MSLQNKNKRINRAKSMDNNKKMQNKKKKSKYLKEIFENIQNKFNYIFPSFGGNFKYQIYYSIFLIILCPILWNFIGRLEFYTHFFTRVINNFYYSTVIIPIISNYRHLYVSILVIRGYFGGYKFIPKVDNILQKIPLICRTLGIIFFFSGLFVSTSSMYALGYIIVIIYLFYLF
jgi:hypothetical protein